MNFIPLPRVRIHVNQISRFLLVFAAVLLGLMGFVGGKKDRPSDGLSWKATRTLTWEDFQGSPQRAHFDALSHCGLAMDMHSESAELVFRVEAVFDPELSWVRDAEATEYLLAHEQLHFDIYERYARELRKRLQEERYDTDYDKIPERIQTHYDAVDALIREAQKRYDAETDHSTIPASQAEWALRIAAELAELQDYAESEFSVSLGD